MTDRINARELTVALWIITVGTVIAALVLAAIGQLLIASAVCLLGGLPATLIVWGIDRRTPARSSAERRVLGLRQGLQIAAVGAAATTVAGALLMTVPDVIGRVPEALLSVGAILLLGGATARRQVQPQHEAVAEAGRTEQASAAPAKRGVDLLLVQKNRYIITLWVAAVSALAVGPALFGLAPRPVIGTSVIVLGGLPLVALTITHRLAQVQARESDD